MSEDDVSIGRLEWSCRLGFSGRPMNIDNMPAGRELDALVAERVMGLKWDPERCRICGWPLAMTRDHGCMEGDCSMRPVPATRADAPPPYSTDIAAALPVWQKAFPVGSEDRSGFPGLIQRNDGWYCTLFYGNGEPMQQTDGARLWLSKAETAPLAICRAALKSVVA